MGEKLTVCCFKKLDPETLRGIIAKAGKGKILAECRNTYHTGTIGETEDGSRWNNILAEAYSIYAVGDKGYAHIIFDPDGVRCISTYPPPNINDDNIGKIEEAEIIDKTEKELLLLIPYDGADRPIKILYEKVMLDIGGTLYKYIKFAEIPEGVTD